MAKRDRNPKLGTPLRKQGRPSGEDRSQTREGRRIEEDRKAEQRREREGPQRPRGFLF